MKLRLRSNSLRLRLTRSEVARLAEEGTITERMAFANAALVYQLESRPGLEGIEAWFAGGAIRVRVPEAMVKDWAATDRVGMEGEAGPLSVLIEKDFQCMHGEKDPDAFEA